MRKNDFEELVTSIKQAGRIRRGEEKPSRVTEIAPLDVKAVRQRLGKSQAAFARMIGGAWRPCRIGNRGDGGLRDQREPC